MDRYAALTALAIALNITVLTPAVSQTRANKALIERYNEGQCDSLAHGLRRWAIGCHCTFECYRQHSYTVRQPCETRWSWRERKPIGEGLCEWRMAPVEAFRACTTTCAKAKGVAQLRP
jgi:hypothetical protein